MPNDKLADGIKGAVGVHSVYLAAKHDENLIGRFTHSGGVTLLDRGRDATKRSVADVMVYMAGKYDQQLTVEEVEMGLFAAATNGRSAKRTVQKRRRPGLDYGALGKDYAEMLIDLLSEAEIGMQVTDIIERFNLYDPSKYGRKTVEQAVGVAMRHLEWTRTRQMTAGVRAYRWYPPEGFFKATVEKQEPGSEPEPSAEVISISSGRDDEWDEFINNFDDDDGEPIKKQPKAKKSSGVKPDAEMAKRIKEALWSERAGITSYEIALHHFDFNAADIEVPKSEDDLPHKVKLSVGATMKSLGWVKKTRRMDGIALNGWHPPDGWDGPVAVNASEPLNEEVILRKRDDQAEAPPERAASVADVLPRLTEVSDFFGDDGDEGGELESEERAYIKLVNLDDGTESVIEGVIIRKKAGTYFTADDGIERMLEWDAEEEIWTGQVSSNIEE